MSSAQSVSNIGLRPPVLCIRSLSKAFASSSASSGSGTAALVEVSVELCDGDVLGLVGPAGAGKTTLLQCAAGLLRRDKGFIDWFGEPFAGGGCLPDLAYIPALPVYYPFLTVRDVLEYRASRSAFPRQPRNGLVASVLARLQLDLLAAAFVRDLPRESVKRLAVAEALVTLSKVILVDTASSDLACPCPPLALRALAAEAADGCAVMVAVRDATLVAPVATRIVLLERGRNAGTFSSDRLRNGTYECISTFSPIATLDRLVAERLH